MSSADDATDAIRAFALIASAAEGSRHTDARHHLDDPLLEIFVIEDLRDHDDVESVGRRTKVQVMLDEELTELLTNELLGELDLRHIDELLGRISCGPRALLEIAQKQRTGNRKNTRHNASLSIKKLYHEYLICQCI